MEQSGRNHTDSRLFNQALILRLILQKGPVSRLTLARSTGLSPAALTVLTAALIEEGLLVEQGEEREEEFPRVGRRSVPLDLNVEAGLALGIHITPRLTRVGLVNLKGEPVLQELGRPPGSDPANSLENLAKTARSLVAQSPLPVIGAGVGAVGLVDRDSGVNRRAWSLGWQNVPVKTILEQQLDMAVLVDNNVRGMTLAEMLFGYGRSHNFRNIALIYLGSGVGGGIVLEGSLYRGSGSEAGEIGHMIIDPNGPACYCGTRGCVEQLAGETAMLKALREAAPFKPGLLRETSLARGGAANLAFEDLIEISIKGDPTALEIVRRAARATGTAVSNIYRVLNPDTIIIAGRIARDLPFFLEEVRTEANRSVIARELNFQVLESSLGDNIGVVGAAALVLQEYLFSNRPLNQALSGSRLI